jgi:hypothetical protein
MSVTIDNVAPIYLSVKTTSSGLRVFYGTTEIDTVLDDVFPEDTIRTNVTVVVKNDAGVPIQVSFNGGTPNPVGVGGIITQTMSMPDAGHCNSMSLTVWSSGSKHHDPIIRLKRKLGNVTPTCTA